MLAATFFPRHSGTVVFAMYVISILLVIAAGLVMRSTLWRTMGSAPLAPVFEPAGFGSWSLTGPLITGFVAKEAVISSWAQTYSVEEPAALEEKIREDFDTASGGHAAAAVWAFLIFLLSYTPCVATLAAQRREIGLRWTLFGLVTQLTTAWVLAVATFQILKVVL